MNGKSKCRILKDIRRKIAQENDIAYVTSECKFQGNCSGTCPKCEAELRYLEEELRKRQKTGKTVAVAGVAAALMVTASGCDLDIPFLSRTAGDMQYEQTQPKQTGTEFPGETTVDELDGDIAYDENWTTMGIVPEETLEVGEVVEETLMGDIVME